MSNEVRRRSCGLYRCAVAACDGYIVVENDPHRVHWLDRQGRITHTYGKQDRESMLSPCHITQDNQGRLLVVDMCNHRLHLLDAGGRFSHYLLTEGDGIKRPTCVCLDEESSRLYVAHSPGKHPNCEVRVYRWPLDKPPNRTKRTLNVHFAD